MIRCLYSRETLLFLGVQDINRPRTTAGSGMESMKPFTMLPMTFVLEG